MAKAKELILQNALELFNTKGSRAVSTNHIAKECGISPGNLYYHFKNKEEIIRALYNQMGAEWDNALVKIETINMETFEQIGSLSEGLFERYRFIHNELYALCQTDAELDKINKERLQGRKLQTKALLLALIENEGFEPISEMELEFLTDTIWLFAIFMLPYKELTNYDENQQISFDATKILIGRFLKKKQGV